MHLFNKEASIYSLRLLSYKKYLASTTNYNDLQDLNLGPVISRVVFLLSHPHNNDFGRKIFRILSTLMVTTHEMVSRE